MTSDWDKDIPVLPGWINFTEAGDRLGVSRQHMHRMAQAGKFKTVHRLGTQRSFVISEEEVNALVAARKAEVEAAAQEAADTPAA